LPHLQTDLVNHDGQDKIDLSAIATNTATNTDHARSRPGKEKPRKNPWPTC